MHTTTTAHRRPRPFHRAASVVARSAGLVTHVLGHVERLVVDVTRDSTQIAGEAQAFYADASAAAQQVAGVVRAAPRATRLVAEVARLLALYKLRGPSEELHRASAKRMYELCVELRGGVLKIGQFASCRVDLLPQPWIDELSRLQDRVPPVPTEGIRAKIEAELGRPIAELFASFDDEPIAAASIAQVHAATLHDGTRVVVKVQVPGIEDMLDADLTALRVIAVMLQDVLVQVDLPTICAELSRSLRAELDYRAEAAHATAAAAAFAGDARVVVPRVIDELSTARVLTMERLDGRPLLAFLDAAEPAELDTVLGTLVHAYCAQILAHGSFQADAHPGNFLVLDGGRVGLLDFGCVQALTPAARRAYAGLAGAILQRDTRTMARLFAEIGFATRDPDDTSSLEQFADMIMGAFRNGADLGSIDPRAQLEEAMRIARANPVVSIPQEFVLLGRVFASLGGLLIRYKPNVNLFAIIAPHLAQAFQKQA